MKYFFVPLVHNKISLYFSSYFLFFVCFFSFFVRMLTSQMFLDAITLLKMPKWCSHYRSFQMFFFNFAFSNFFYLHLLDGALNPCRELHNEIYSFSFDDFLFHNLIFYSCFIFLQADFKKISLRLFILWFLIDLKKVWVIQSWYH